MIRGVKLVLIFLLAMVYIRGLFIPIMNNNSAHHANIALHMVLTDDYVSLLDQGHDYLDKPHLLFWLAALSYYIFGVTSFAYKFASFLFAAVGIFSTYKLGRLLFGKDTGTYAALILASSTAFILSTNDVRMDAMLTSCIAFASWQLFEYIINKRTSGLFLGALGLALGFATKGMVAIAVPALAIAFYYLHQKRYHELFSLRWVGLGLLTLLFVSPVLYCFYLQFDLHPEKVIRNTTGNSGLLFLLIGQSVDRYTGAGWGKRANDPFFLVHTFLWAFLPWCILAYTALIKNIRDIIRSRSLFNPAVEVSLTLTTLLIFILVSGSQFKNPHYVNLLFPYFAILTARFITTVDAKYLPTLYKLQAFIAIGTVLLIIAVNMFAFPVDEPLVIAGSLLITGIIFYLAWKIEEKRNKIMFISFAGSVLCFFLMNFNFYPKLLYYQSGHFMAEDIKRSGIDASHIRYLEGGSNSFSMEFSAQTLIPRASADSLKYLKPPVYVFGTAKDLEQLQERNIAYKVLLSRDHYNVTTLKYKFLNPADRPETLRKHYLVVLK